MDINELKNNIDNLYGYVAENYYKWDKEDLKELLLNAIYVANDNEKIVSEYIDRNI